MSGIAGITQPDKQRQVQHMLDWLAHRGPAGQAVIQGKSATVGVTWSWTQTAAIRHLRQSHLAWDEVSDDHFTWATADEFLLKRDRLGIAPLYYGWADDGALCFASEVKALSEVIYYLESFDAWLVRSSITNYLVAQRAAEYVPAILSGEGGDELFAGYEYLKSLDPTSLPDELIDVTSRLHNTALQRVDRCASAHGTVAHVAFLDPEVVDYALRIPVEYKLRDGVEKWILRQAMAGTLPESVLNRPKAKFWQGAGVEDILAHYAAQKISDADFAHERRLPNDWLLNTKEELLYYRIFREHFGVFDDLSWMGRTKGSPTS